MAITLNTKREGRNKLCSESIIICIVMWDYFFLDTAWRGGGGR